MALRLIEVALPEKTSPEVRTLLQEHSGIDRVDSADTHMMGWTSGYSPRNGCPTSTPGHPVTELSEWRMSVAPHAAPALPSAWSDPDTKSAGGSVVPSARGVWLRVSRHFRLVVACAFLPICVQAAEYTTAITPDQETPPTPSTATGAGRLRLDAVRMLAFEIAFEGLHGAETAASIHGPARPGASAGVLFALPLGNRKSGTLGPLDSAQVADLDAGLWYVCIHSTHHPGGEIRGQILLAVSVAPDTWGGVKRRFLAR